jgi:hypothetical protein
MIVTPQVPQCWHLLPEPPTSELGLAAVEKIEVPAAGTACLPWGPDPADAAVLEAVTVGRQPFLLMLSAGLQRPRVNGQRAPCVSLLSVRDQVQLPDGRLFHVTRYTQPAIGRPGSDHLGKECPVCRTRFGTETTVYLCPACGTAAHCEGEEKPADQRLECIRLSSECPTCGAPVVMTQGYTYLPEL